MKINIKEKMQIQNDYKVLQNKILKKKVQMIK